jgi:hypothetical protein
LPLQPPPEEPSLPTLPYRDSPRDHRIAIDHINRNHMTIKIKIHTPIHVRNNKHNGEPSVKADSRSEEEERRNNCHRHNRRRRSSSNNNSSHGKAKEGRRRR